MTDHASSPGSAGSDPPAGRRSCAPVRGPGRYPVEPVVVDGDLIWVVRAPALRLGVARPPTRRALFEFSLDLEIDIAAAHCAALTALFPDDAVDAAARTVAARLAELPDLPDLPFVGEPFGGEEGTD